MVESKEALSGRINKTADLENINHLHEAKHLDEVTTAIKNNECYMNGPCVVKHISLV